MFTQIIEKEIKEVKFEIEDLEVLVEGEGMPGWDRGELIDKRYKLQGKLAGLEFALQTYQTNKKKEEKEGEEEKGTNIQELIIKKIYKSY